MIHFFFYNNLCHLELIEKISKLYNIKYGYTYVKLFDKDKNLLYIEDKQNENTTILNGKFVSFHTLSLTEIIDKLSKIDEIKYKNSYKISTIKVYFMDNNVEDFEEAYIIY
jgi:hypothetical protein